MFERQICIDTERVDVLEGTPIVQHGGLIVKKESNHEDTFKKPSLLGLERLAKQKKEENRRKRLMVDEGSETLGISENTRMEISRYVHVLF